MNDDVTRIACAYLSNNSVTPDRLPDVLKSIIETVKYAELPKAPVYVEAPKVAFTPAVDTKASVFSDHILCLECGKSLKSLKRHLKAEHNLTEDQYRAKWDLPDSYPMIAPDYADKRREIAKRIGLGKKRGSAEGDE